MEAGKDTEAGRPGETMNDADSGDTTLPSSHSTSGVATLNETLLDNNINAQLDVTRDETLTSTHKLYTSICRNNTSVCQRQVYTDLSQKAVDCLQHVLPRNVFRTDVLTIMTYMKRRCHLTRINVVSKLSVHKT